MTYFQGKQVGDVPIRVKWPANWQLENVSHPWHTSSEWASLCLLYKTELNGNVKRHSGLLECR